MTKSFLLLPALALMSAFPFSSKAQSLQNQHKTIVWVRTWDHCADGFTNWCYPFYDSLAECDNTPNFPAYAIHYEAGNTSWIDLTTNAQPTYGNWPSLAVENMGVGILAGSCTQHEAVDSLRKLAKQYTQAPAAVSVGFTKTMETADSVHIKTRARFNVATAGLYSATVFIVEDSLRAWQAQMVVINDTVAHRNMMRTPMSGYLWGQLFSNSDDTSYAAGEEVVKDFGYKIPSNWNNNKLRYVVAVYKWEGSGMKKLINVTDGKFVTTSVNELTHTDITGNMNVFPVPANNFVNVEVAGNEPMENANISLYDISSRKVAELYTGTVHPGKPMNVKLPQALPAGNYMLQLYTDKASAVKQVIIQ